MRSSSREGLLVLAVAEPAALAPGPVVALAVSTPTLGLSPSPASGQPQLAEVRQCKLSAMGEATDLAEATASKDPAAVREEVASLL